MTMKASWPNPLLHPASAVNGQRLRLFGGAESGAAGEQQVGSRHRERRTMRQTRRLLHLHQRKGMENEAARSGERNSLPPTG